MKKLIQWLKSSLESEDGKSSSKAITLLWIVILSTGLHILFGHIALRIAEKDVPTEASLKVMDRIRDLITIDWTVMLILFGVATIAMIVQLFKVIRGQPTDDAVLIEKVTKSSQTITEVSPKPKTNEETINTDNTTASDS